VDAAGKFVAGFGGRITTSQSYVGDVHVLDISSKNSPTWVSFSQPAGGPGPREQTGLAYNPSSGEFIVVGGSSGTMMTVWRISLSAGGVPSWTSQAASGFNVASRLNPALIFRADGSTAVMYGGNLQSDVALLDTTTWRWTQLSASGGPNGRNSGGFIYACPGGQEYFVTSIAGNGASDFTDIGIFDLQNDVWMPKTISGSPGKGADIAFSGADLAAKSLYIFGGFGNPYSLALRKISVTVSCPAIPTTGVPTTGIPTTGIPTTGVPTTGVPATTTGVPATTTGVPTTTGVFTTTDIVGGTGKTVAAASGSSSDNNAGSQTVLVVIVVVAVLCCLLIVAVLCVIRFQRHNRRLRDQLAEDTRPGSTLASPPPESPSSSSWAATEDHYGHMMTPGQMQMTPPDSSGEGAYQRFQYLPISGLASHSGANNGSNGGGNTYAALALEPSQLSVDQSEPLGRGEYGVVYKGVYAGQEVAVKHMLKSCDDDAMREFLAEAELMERISDHRNVLRFIGLIYHAGLPAIVTELCAGSSLLNAYTVSPLDETTLWFVARGIASGMAHLAKSRVVHRDLACRNILLDSSWNPKVCDFGLSRMTYLNGDDANTTKSNVGPIRWMSPESLEKRQYSEKSDVWMFGATLVELIGRCEPHSEISGLEVGTRTIMRRVRPEPPQGTPAAMGPVIESCVQWEPSDRPTFAELEQRLAGS
jgi:Protein tyrosine and serine/threonine kinase